MAIIDDEDAEKMAGWRFYARWDSDGSKPYVVGNRWNSETGKQEKVRLHRLILGDENPLDVDHQSRDPLDNRKANLRFGTTPDNQANSNSRGGTSRFKNVSWTTSKKRWRVAFRAEGEFVFVGYFRSEIEAALAADAAMRKHHGEFARLNFPTESEESALSDFVSEKLRKSVRESSGQGETSG